MFPRFLSGNLSKLTSKLYILVRQEALLRSDLSERQCASNEAKRARGEPAVQVVACGSEDVADERSGLTTRAIGGQPTSFSRGRLLRRLAPCMASLGLVYVMHYLINQGLVCTLLLSRLYSTLTCTCSLADALLSLRRLCMHNGRSEFGKKCAPGTCYTYLY